MMMECPRCGFTQPKDRYCASCGLDVDSFVVKPQPVLLRILQNPNFHLSLIGILIVLVVGYIFYTQGAVVTRQMGQLLEGLPLLSRDAGDPNSPDGMQTEAAATGMDAANVVAEANSLPESTETSTTESATAAAAAAAIFDKLDVSSWEIPKDALAPLIASGTERVGEGNAGRAFLIANGEKVSEAIQSAGHRLSVGRTVSLTTGTAAQIEAPMAPNDPFQFGFYVQIVKHENRVVSVKWDSTLILPAGDGGAAGAGGGPGGGEFGASGGEGARGQAPGSGGAMTPPTRPPIESMLTGRADLKDKSILLIIFDPATHIVREDLVSRAGDGPWNIFLSENYRTSATDWVMLIELK